MYSRPSLPSSQAPHSVILCQETLPHVPRFSFLPNHTSHQLILYKAARGPLQSDNRIRLSLRPCWLPETFGKEPSFISEGPRCYSLHSLTSPAHPVSCNTEPTPPPGHCTCGSPAQLLHPHLHTVVQSWIQMSSWKAFLNSPGPSLTKLTLSS